MLLEENGYYISIASQEVATRDDVVIDYQPKANITKYSYTVIKDGKKGETIYVEDNSASRIVLSETGHYTVEFENVDSNNQSETFKTGNYIVDKEAPRIEISKESLKVEIGSTVDIMSGVKAIDNEDGILTEKVTTNLEGQYFSTVGKKSVTYKVTDTAGNTAFETVTFEVVDNNREMVFLKECAAIGMVCLVLIVIIRYYRMQLLEKRIARHSLETKRKNLGVFDKIGLVKEDIIDMTAHWLSKFSWARSYGKVYEKYQIAFREKSSVHIIAKKILMSLFFFLLSVLASALRLEMLSFLQMVMALLIGYLLVDIIYFVRYYFYRDHVENDLLQAIIVMNNAFKSGHSIPQAVELVSQELEGDIHEEFARMSKEFTMGLSTDEVFERFAKRIEIPEVTYLTSTISILNQTGGNIVKVFTSIEKTLMNKKKLRLELRALTSSAKIVTYILMLLPILFAIAITLISPDYFLPFIESTIGWLCLAVILLVYLLYICIIKKIMKVRM